MEPFYECGKPLVLDGKLQTDEYTYDFYGVEEETFNLEELRNYEVDWIEDCCSKLPANLKDLKPVGTPTPGYLRLCGILKDIDRKPSAPSWDHISKVERSLDSRGSNRFISKGVSKKVDQWDATSEEAFQSQIVTLFNRLTKEKITDVVQEIRKILGQKPDYTQRQAAIKFISDTIGSKAAVEHQFASIYAEFTKLLASNNTKKDRISDALNDLCNEIGKHADNKFYQSLSKTMGVAGQSNLAVGYAKFYAALSTRGVIDDDHARDRLDLLIATMQESEVLLEHWVEMACEFVKEAGPDFAKKMTPRCWQSISALKLKKGIPNRLMFLLMDIEELRDIWVLGKKPKSVKTTAASKSEKDIRDVRSALETYKEGDDVSIDLPVEAFLRAIGHIIPDRLHEWGLVCDFIGYILHQKKPQRREVGTCLCQIAQEYVENNMDCDYPDLWELFDDLVYYLALHEIIHVDNMKYIWKGFPESHSCDILNGMKWYLYDNHYFTKAVTLDKKFPREIRDALEMPATIDKPMPAEFHVSKLISCAVIRSVCAKASEAGDFSIAALGKWKPYLKAVMEKNKQFFVEEFTINIEDYQFEFSIDDVVELCK